jgi:hypothetical protein
MQCAIGHILTLTVLALLCFIQLGLHPAVSLMVLIVCTCAITSLA